MKESIFFDNVRTFFASLDSTLYWLIKVFYQAINGLAYSQIISADAINEVSMRIYAFIGLFMLFKISFSLINYIIDPNKINDKSVGGGQLIKRIIITITLVITVPFGFDLLRNVQGYILEDGIIPTLIFGDGNSNNNGTYSVLMDGTPDNTKCVDNNDNVIFAKTEKVENYITLLSIRPFFQLSEQAMKSSHFESDFNDIKEEYCSGGSNSSGESSASSLLISGALNAPQSKLSTSHYYVINYSFFISSIVGTVVALVFLTFCFDIALRTVKLAFLEIIAPVPILSYIDPDSGKKGMFSKWFKEVWTTWVSLFIRLASVFLAIYLIGLLDDEKGFTFIGDYKYSGSMIWLKILIVIGILMFAKSAPKLLEELLGFKSTGFTLNPLKKVNDNAIGGKLISGVSHGVAGAIGGGAAGFTAGKEAGTPFRGAAFGVASGFSGGTKSKSMYDSISKNMNQVYKNMSGNDLINFSPQRALMNFDGKGDKDLKEIKKYITAASNTLAKEQSRLNDSAFASANLSKELTSSGYDISNLKEARDAINTRINNKNDIIEKMNGIINSTNADAKEKTDALDKLKKATSELGNLDLDSKKIDTYEKSIEKQNEIRNSIESINRDISKLNDQKKDIIKFNNIDTSDKTSLDKVKTKYDISEIKD